MTPEEAADLIILDRLQKDPELFLALQFRDERFDANALAARFPGMLVQEDAVERILAAIPTPDPRYPRGTSTLMREPEYRTPGMDPDRSPQGWRPLLWRDVDPPRPKQTQAAQRAFAEWVEGARDYEPGIAGEVD